MNRRRGVTLIDCIAAIVILSVALPPLVSAFVDASMQSMRPVQSATARLLAAERLEEIIARRYQASGYSQVTAANFPTENPVTGFTTFTRSVSVTEVAASDLTTAQSGSGLKRVTVTVSWQSGTRSVKAERVFADY